MKKTFTLIAVLFTFSISAQVADYYHDGDEPNVQVLFEFPTDPSRLLQCRYVPGTGQFLEYSLEEITNGVLSQITVPSCTQITSLPIEVAGGLVFSGLTQNNGNELFFFDGVNSNMFDLNPGIDGSSYIGINNIDGEIFFNANDGIGFQAYKFIDGTTVEQITFSTEFVAGVSAVWGNAIYYSEQTYDAVLSTYTFSLKKALWNGIDYDYSFIKDVEVGIGYQCFWGAPVIKWNKLFLSEVIIDYQQLFPNTYRVISVTDTDVAATLHDTVTTENSTVNIFEWNNDVYFYLSSQNEIYRSQDGLTFSVEETLTGGDVITQMKIADGKVFFIVSNFANITSELVRYDGTFTSIHSADYLKISIDNNGLLFVSDFNFNTDDLYIHYITISNDALNSVFVGDGNVSFYEGGALFFDDKYTFIFDNYGGGNASSDVLQILGIASLDEVAVTSVSIFPNPILIGGAINVEVDIQSHYQLLTVEGKIIQSGAFAQGGNSLQFGEGEGMVSGTYLLVINNAPYRIVIE
jgi:hypothetical protein